MDKVTIDGWVARDSSGELYLYPSMPHKMIYTWQIDDNSALTHEVVMLNDLDFPQVRWDNDKPTPVTITIQIK